MGHVAWFQEHYLLRALDHAAPLMAGGDNIYDSFNVSYKLRWSHDFPNKQETLDYAREVLERSITRLEGREPSENERYLYQLVADHERMHSENILSVRKQLGYAMDQAPSTFDAVVFEQQDCRIQSGTYVLGAEPDAPYVLDNEQWAHPVELDAFAIANTPVTNAEFAEFLDAAGYRTRSLWDRDGWNWRRRNNIGGPLYWQKRDGVWHERHFATWTPIRPHHPICHINLNEARAYCRFVGRRLPSEAEWEVAATYDPKTKTKRPFPWGDAEPSDSLVHMDIAYGGTTDVRDKAAGDSPHGCRQMIGNVWEWTDSKLVPYPGFSPGPYEDYSRPYLGKKPVLRGGAWPTSQELIRSTWRNFFIKHRRNIFAGLRTCAR